MGRRALQAMERVHKRVSDAAPKKELVWARGATAIVLSLVTAAGPQLLSLVAGAVMAHIRARALA
jgi:hypothetical protein